MAFRCGLLLRGGGLDPPLVYRDVESVERSVRSELMARFLKQYSTELTRLVRLWYRARVLQGRCRLGRVRTATLR